MFLGHRVARGKISMDSAKVKAILEWEPSTIVSSLRSFSWLGELLLEIYLRVF